MMTSCRFAIRGAVLFGLVITSVSANAHPEDVTSPGDRYVKVEAKADRVSFQLWSHVSGLVRVLGPNDSYAIEELRSQRTIEQAQVGGALVADVVAAAGGAAVAVFEGLPLLGGAGAILTATGGTITTYAIGGTLAGAAASQFWQAINPVTQYAQAQTLSEAVVLDQSVVLAKWKTFDRFVINLETVLNKL